MIDVVSGQLAFLTLVFGMVAGAFLRWMWGEK